MGRSMAAVGSDAMSAGGADKIKAAMDKLTTASHKLAEAMYKASTPPPGGAAPGGAEDAKPEGGTSSSGYGNVVDAEFVDVEDNKKN